MPPKNLRSGRKFWDFPKYTMICGGLIVWNSTHALTGFWQDEVNNETLLKNMVISITRFHIWKVRNSIKLDDKVIDLSGSCKILKATFINHIEILLSLHKENEPLKLYLTILKQGIHEHNLL